MGMLSHSSTLVVFQSYLLRPINHELYNSFDPLKFRTHIFTCPNRRDGIFQRGWLVWVCKKAIFDRFLSLSFSTLLKL